MSQGGVTEKDYVTDFWCSPVFQLQGKSMVVPISPLNSQVWPCKNQMDEGPA